LLRAHLAANSLDLWGSEGPSGMNLVPETNYPIWNIRRFSESLRVCVGIS